MVRRGAILLLLPFALSGCVAAAVPLAAGGLLAKKQLDDNKPKPTPAPAPSDRVPVFAPGTGPKVSLSGNGTELPAAAKPGAAAVVASPAPAPVPVAMGRSSGFADFAAYAVAHAASAPVGSTRRSAVLDQSSLPGTPRMGDCGNLPPAVVIDLDPGDGSFNLDNPPAPAAGLAESLATIRAAGVTVLWSAGLPGTATKRLTTILMASGLDPAGTDRLLLLRKGESRKQERRDAAQRDWCIVAIAGDRRGDFDELFDYLRDPDGPLAKALDANIGAGWFLTPQPID